MGDIVLKDKAGESKTYSNVSVVKLADSQGNYNDYSLSVQADYEQNDSKALDYIKNRPFYVIDGGETIEVFLLNDVPLTYLGGMTSHPTFGFVAGNLSTDHTCTVICGGVSKEIPVGYNENGNNWLNIGPYNYVGDDLPLIAAGETVAKYGFSIIKPIENPEYIGGAVAEGNVIASISDVNTMLLTTFGLPMADAGKYIVSAVQAYSVGETVKKIDAKFLPEGLSTGALPAVAVDFSSFADGTFTETLSDGSKVTYTVTFDGSGNPININNGKSDFAIVWG